MIVNSKVHKQNSEYTTRFDFCCHSWQSQEAHPITTDTTASVLKKKSHFLNVGTLKHSHVETNKIKKGFFH